MGNFKVIMSSDVEEFEKSVSEYMEKGWLLINCNSSKLDSSDSFSFHAFVKKLAPRPERSFRSKDRDRKSGSRNFGRGRHRSRDEGRDRRPKFSGSTRSNSKSKDRENRDKEKYSKGFKPEKYSEKPKRKNTPSDVKKE